MDVIYLVVKGTPGSLGYEREPHIAYSWVEDAQVEALNVEYGEVITVPFDPVKRLFKPAGEPR